MRGRIIRRVLVVMIIVAPILSYPGCKKQAKCGCDGDVLFSLTKEPATVYFNETGSSISFTRYGNYYDTYIFCNPGEMFAKYFKDFESGDLLEVTGDVFWDCTYLYQSSNYSYQSYYKTYNVQVTEVIKSPFGKK